MRRNIRDKILLMVLIGAFSGCMNTSIQYASVKPTLDPTIRQHVSAIKDDNEITHSVKRGILMLDSGNYPEALKSFQAGLRLNPKYGQLHFLQGLTYHLQSLSGDSSKVELAKTGYTVALKFDPANYWASYFLGQIYFSEQRYLDAQNQFSYGLLYAPDNLSLLKALSIAAYYSKNTDIGHWAAQKAYQNNPADKAALRAMLFNSAANGNFDLARNTLTKYQQLGSYDQTKGQDLQTDFSSSQILNERLEDWETFHKAHKQYAQLEDHQVYGSDAQAEGTLMDFDERLSNRYQDEGSPLADSIRSSDTNKNRQNFPRMAAIDVVILSTEESRFQNRGVNLLAGLQATLEGTLYSRIKQTGHQTTFNSSNPQKVNTDLESFDATFIFSALNYNFNIFNDGVNKTEILARPSLLAVEEETSRFYSGAILHVQLSSINADGSLEDIPIGLHMEVTPKFLDEETLEIVVHARRDSIESNFEEVGFTAFSQTSTTSIDSTAVLKFGETLILSGLSENENNNVKDGVPLLQNIPVLQYLFSNENALQTKRSVIILLTPRKPQFINGDLTTEELTELSRQQKQKNAPTKELIKKHGIKLTSNVDAAFAVLREGELYREFRQGDLKLEYWHDGDTLGGALKRTLNFLYY